MWVITNLKTHETLLFKSVKAWQTFVDQYSWHNINVKFAHIRATNKGG